ncbi:ArsC/Spx/MgsR family protein [Lactococcus insecticola]|uniref:Transcriptional regulator Spx n=1 Tax=Pseudolactococcus insecticola TaxID=2709158 RepID=A0A6A0BAK5_9LACT|nr:ArsC/Spx/MgsR family protein [Lactococcus insecticola]GFH41414.1 hypothetical protein Hs20B_18120 [Lactococcus insecticola]
MTERFSKNKVIIYQKREVSNQITRNTLKVKAFMKKHEIPYEEREINELSFAELSNIIQKSSLPIDDFISQKSKKYTNQYGKNRNAFLDLTYSQVINFMLSNPTTIKGPITMKNDIILVGYSTENIRVFLPRLYRTLELQKK